MNHNEYTMSQRISSIMVGIYGWMCCALTLTAASAYYVAMTPSLVTFFYMNRSPLIIISIAQIMLVLAIIFLLPRLHFITALVLFLLYATSLGITLSSIFFVFTDSSIVSTFITTALMFGCMSVYGYVTKSDLTTMGNISMMALVGLIIGMLVNIFVQSPRFYYFLSAVGVIVFVLLTAYDTQKIKQFISQTYADGQAMRKITIMCALTLYLDFINLFLFLLNFMGDRRGK